jgi:DNA-3-methyladenine glycosylase
MILPRSFYERNPKKVARQLLGKILVCKNRKARIVETEAYYGMEDPASVIRRRKSEIMFGPGGRAFIYMVHGYWLLNVTACREGKPGAVLLRAGEPLLGLRKDLRGPGKLTRGMGIDISYQGADLTRKGNLFIQKGGKERIEIGVSKRIGVKKDLEEPNRFYIKGNPWVSR